MNCRDTIENCIASVANQTWTHREHLIIDGASNDGTVEIIRRHIADIDYFISQPDAGIYDALNHGIRHSTGDVIGFLHADDEYASNDVLSTIAREFEDEAVHAVYGDLVYVSRRNSNQIIRRWKSKPFKGCYLKRGWMPPHPTLYLRREWYIQTNGFDTSYKISSDYLSVLTFFSQLKVKSVYLPRILVKMRVGGASNKSIKAMINKSKEDWRILRSFRFGVFDSVYVLVCKNLSKVGQFISLN